MHLWLGNGIGEAFLGLDLGTKLQHRSDIYVLANHDYGAHRV
jgi:hypothetical protein